MTERYDFEIRYWGTTGTIPRPLTPDDVGQKIASTLEYLRDTNQLDHYRDKQISRHEIERMIRQNVPTDRCSTLGGNTSCIQIQTPNTLCIVDAGSGLRNLGAHLNRVWNAKDYKGNREANLFITHAHMDHTLATAFAEPFFDAANSVTIWAPQHVLDSLTTLFGSHSSLRQTYFPIDFDQLKGVKRLQPLSVDQTVQLEDLEIHTCTLNHPGDCVGYRFERGSSSVVFASDHEQAETPDPTLTHFAKNASLLYADAQYRQAEYEGEEGVSGKSAMSRRGWGHRTIESSVQSAVAAGVRRLHLGHHDPQRTDQDLVEIETMAVKLAQNLLVDKGRSPDDCRVEVAKEGMCLQI